MPGLGRARATRSVSKRVSDSSSPLSLEPNHVDLADCFDTNTPRLTSSDGNV